MSDDSVDKDKRRFLITLSSVTAGLGASAWAWSMVDYMNPGAEAKAAGAPVEADISGLKPGELTIVEWRKKPIWIVRRTEQTLKDLAKVTDYLSDPTSGSSKQPEYALNEYRSLKSEYLIMEGICTHLGCSPKHRPEIGAADLGGDQWQGGFFCPCHGSKFDNAGRVYIGSPAPSNLVIPPHKYLNDTTILIGVNTEVAAKEGAA